MRRVFGQEGLLLVPLAVAGFWSPGAALMDGGIAAAVRQIELAARDAERHVSLRH